MRYDLRIRPEAEADIRDAYDWYEEQTLGLGEEFLLAVEAVLRSIQRTPFLYAQIHKQIQRALTRRFPYGIFYLVEKDEVAVLAVFHARRDPRQWQQRV